MNKAEQHSVNIVDPAQTEAVDTEIDLLELFYRLIERWKYIVAAACVGALVMIVYSFVLATPIYEATSKLYVMTASDSAINLSDLQIGSYLTSDYQEVFNTWEVQEMVLQNLGLDYSYQQLSEMITVSNPSNTRILNVTAKHRDPQTAARLANEYASVAGRYISETMKTDEPSLLSEALTPTRPVSPKKARNTILGFLIGALLMIAIVTIQFIMDDKVKTAEDIRRYADLPTLALVPVNGTDANRGSKSKDRRV